MGHSSEISIAQKVPRELVFIECHQMSQREGSTCTLFCMFYVHLPRPSLLEWILSWIRRKRRELTEMSPNVTIGNVWCKELYCFNRSFAFIDLCIEWFNISYLVQSSSKINCNKCLRHKNYLPYKTLLRLCFNWLVSIGVHRSTESSKMFCC